jgi:hypothetical protein
MIDEGENEGRCFNCIKPYNPFRYKFGIDGFTLLAAGHPGTL